MDLNVERAERAVTQYFGVHQREIGDWENGEIIIEATAPVAPHLAGANGGIRSGALLAMIDHVGGLAGGLASLPDGWVVSTNLSMRLATLDHVGPLRIHAEVLRRGRSSVINALHVTDDGAAGATVAEAVITNAVLIPESGAPIWKRPADMNHVPRPDLPPLLEWLAVRDLEPEEGTGVEFMLRDDLRNPWGILHGAVVAVVADIAGERVVGASTGRRVATTDTVLHFLSPGRVGPVRANVRVLGERADGHVTRVEMHDRGADDRVIAVAITTVRAVEHR
jgi:uncharacterized protein (TIGR00369 family)